MKQIINTSIHQFIIPSIILALCLTSCRPQGDDLMSYGQNDVNSFAAANASFSGQFKTMWMALNENYGIWDYEAAKGLNWDAVYTTYLPKFEALDDTTRKTKVKDTELEDLYTQFLDSLHDGHLMLQFKNLHTGSYIDLTPSNNRNTRERAKELESEKPHTTLQFYKALSSDDLFYAGSYMEACAAEMAAYAVDSVCKLIVAAADNYLKLVDKNGGPNATNDSIYAGVEKLKAECEALIKLVKNTPDVEDEVKNIVTTYNNMCARYDVIGAQLDVNMPTMDEGIANDELGYIRTAVFHDGVAYLRFGGFSLSTYLADPEPTDTTSLLYFYHRAVNQVWHNWFDTIQTLHQEGQLAGVIIDVRGNEGGIVDDYQYALGALLPSGGYESHKIRVKNGIGRYDFCPLVPALMKTYNEKHVVIDKEPIVVLANIYSVSMAEITTWGVTTLPNGYFIGTRTWGGLSILYDSPAAYSQSYSGIFGIKNETPVYGYVPRYVSLFGDNLQPLEGVGVTPNLNKPLDVNYWKTQKRDNQLEAALDYIHAQ